MTSSMRSYRSSEISASGPSELSTPATIWHTRKRTALSLAVARLRRKPRKDSVKSSAPVLRAGVTRGGEVDQETNHALGAEVALEGMEVEGRWWGGDVSAREIEARARVDGGSQVMGARVRRSPRRDGASRRCRRRRARRGVLGPLWRGETGRFFIVARGTGASAAGRGRGRRADRAKAHLELEKHGEDAAAQLREERLGVRVASLDHPLDAFLVHREAHLRVVEDFFPPWGRSWRRRRTRGGASSVSLGMGRRARVRARAFVEAWRARASLLRLRRGRMRSR